MKLEIDDLINKYKGTSKSCIVVGSGPGGAISACLLAENACNVLLIEQGASIKASEQNPFSTFDIPKMYHHAGLNMTIGQTPIKLIQGSVMGGGSEINSGLYHRTPESILKKRKNNFGVEHLDASFTASLFEENETELSIQNIEGDYPKCSQRLLDLCKKTSWDIQEIPRWVN